MFCCVAASACCRRRNARRLRCLPTCPMRPSFRPSMSIRSTRFRPSTTARGWTALFSTAWASRPGRPTCPIGRMWSSARAAPGTRSPWPWSASMSSMPMPTSPSARRCWPAAAARGSRSRCGRLARQNVVERQSRPRHEVTVAMVGKYVEHADAYKSISEALMAGGISEWIKVNVRPVESEEIEATGSEALEGVDAILVPGGFGERGFEGKVAAVRHAREQGIPYFGICLGLQAAAVEFARNVCGLEDANTVEVDAETARPIVAHATERHAAKSSLGLDLGGPDLRSSMCLGAQRCRLESGSRVRQLYGVDEIVERHRHRYEVNPEYRELLEKGGLRVTGTSLDERHIEVMELPGHPWFLATQFHPEFTSTPRDAHPLFSAFVRAALACQKNGRDESGQAVQA